MDIGAIDGGTTMCSFTPVRRRESTINTRQFQGGQEQEWTAARCHRLLRALTSRVAILNKELGRFSAGKQNEKDQVRENGRGGKKTVKSSAGADWVQTRKRIRQTYSRKSTRTENDLQRIVGKDRRAPPKKGQQSLVPGEILIPTPILARARGEPLAEEVPTRVPDAVVVAEPVRGTKRSRTRYLANDGESHFQLSESLLGLRKRITAARYTTYEGIYSGLEALIRATTTSEAQPRRKGAQSLLSMSLRAVPRYITQQEALLQAHMEKTGSKSAIENRDISSEIYDELENLGSSGNGWKRLKIIVRSHGIQLVSDAISAGLLDVEFSGALIALCVNTSAIDEAQRLLSALLTFSPCLLPRTPYDTPPRPLVMLWKFTEHTGRYCFQYRQLSGMVCNNILPVEWLATKDFGPIWTRVVHSLAPCSDSIEPMSFLDLTLSMLSDIGTPAVPETCSANQEAVHTTFSSLLTILSSVVILSRGAEMPESGKTLGCLFEYEHVSSLLQSCLVQKGHSSTTLDGVSPLLLLANLFVHELNALSADFCSSLLQCLLRQLAPKHGEPAASSPIYLDVVDFICLVAHCCGRGTSTSGFEHLQHLHLLIESFVDDRDSGNILKGLIVDSAFAFAQKVPDRKHLDYATVVDEKFCAKRFEDEDGLLAGLNTNHEERKTGFRWEEGIGEWVTATPVIPVAKRNKEESPSESENDTPFRPPPKVRRIKILTKESNVYSTTVPAHEVVDIDELGSCFQGDHWVRDGSVPESDESASSCPSSSLLMSDESTGSTSDVEVSFIDALYDSDGLLSEATLDSPIGNRYEAIDRAPRLSRRLFRDTEDWNLSNNAPRDSASPSLPSESSESEVQRDYIDRAPRLGRRALRYSQAWQMFDESDDELSFFSVSSQGDQVLQDVTNTTDSSSRRLRKSNPLVKQRRSVPNAISQTDSEDELCI